MNTVYYTNLVAGNIYKTKVDPAIPDVMYVGLSSTEPTVDGTNFTEPSASVGYARTALVGLSEPVNGVVKNQYAISFDESTSDWGSPITHYGLYDAETGGHLCIYGELISPKTVEADSVMTLKANAITLKVLNE